MSFDTLSRTILDKLKEIAQTENIVGKPIQIDGTTLIPISKVSIGFGMGQSAGKGELAGSGGGISVEPIAFVVVTEGIARIMPLSHGKDVWSKVIDLVPDALAMIKREDRG